MPPNTESDPLFRLAGSLVGRIQYDAMTLAANAEQLSPFEARALALDVAANAQATWRLLGYSDDDMADELLRQQALSRRDR